MVILKTIVGNLSANVNEITFTDNIIDSNSIIEVYYDSNDVYTVETWQREHTIGVVTSDHDFPVSVKVLINNVVAFEPYDDSELLSRLSSDEDDITALDGRLDSAEDDIDNLENDVDSLETALSGKQDTLTAGDNITIENNVISASGSNVIYSTTERIVGTWTDGSTLYERTVRVSVNNTGSSLVTLWNDEPIIIKRFNGCFIFRVSENTASLTCRPTDNSYKLLLYTIGYNSTNGTYAEVELGSQRGNAIDLSLTLQYTKV